MFSLYAGFTPCSLIILALGWETSAFFCGGVSRLHHGHPIASVPRTSYPDQLHTRGSLSALRMTGGGATESAEAKAQRLAEQAAALREEAAASEAELRPLEEAPEGGVKASPEVRPEDMPPDIKISDNMKSRLRQELVSQGADPNKSVGNPILVVSAVIALLVIIGGKGIFY